MTSMMDPDQKEHCQMGAPLQNNAFKARSLTGSDAKQQTPEIVTDLPLSLEARYDLQAFL